MFKQSKRIILPLLFTAVTFLVAFGPKSWQENDVLKKLIAKVTYFETNYPQEKAYLHVDKPYYAAGEDIWFSAYLVNSSDHAPSPLSKVLYVELITPQDSILQRVVLQMQEGKGSGDFTLSDSIPEGLYRLRAYTSWMQNFPEDYFFHQKVQIWNPRESDIVPSAAFSFRETATGDSVTVQLQLMNTKAEPAKQMPLSYTVKQGEKRSKANKRTTDAAGKTRLTFFVPKGAAQQNAQLELAIAPATGTTPIIKRILVPKRQQALDVQFFPEGGHLISGFWNNIGFKAVDAQGLGQDIKGTVHDQAGAKVAEFSSLKFGMGRLGFMPEKGKRYEARLKGPEGTETVYPLPQVQDKGVVMTVDNSKPEQVKVKCYTVGYANAAEKPAGLHLVAQSRGTVFFGASSTSGRDVFQVDIPKEKFPSGISQITLFNQAGEPVSERLVFINQGPQLQVSLTPDKPVYKPREKVTLQVQVKDQAGNPVAGNFSLGVTDAGTVTQDPFSANLVSYLQLSSDLRGNIESPGYYFSSQQPEVVQALDNLMLTQGWRRFVWKEILQDKYPTLSSPLEQGLSVNGVVTRYNKKPEANAVVTLFDVKNLRNALFTQTDAQGRFSIALPPLTDSSRVALQARNQKDKSQLLVNLEDLAPAKVQPHVPFAPLAAPLSGSQWAYLRMNREQQKIDQSMGKGVVLGEIVVRGRKNPDMNRSLADRTTLHTPGDVSYSVKGDRFPPGIDIISSLPGRTAGVAMVEGKLVLRGTTRQSFDFGGEGGASEAGSTEPLYLIDGVRADMGMAQTIAATDVERVDVLMPGAPSAIYGSEGVNGIISIIMKVPGSYAAKNTTARWQGVALYRGPRFQTKREFYMPRYDKPSEVYTPDWRTTLYWNPTIKTDAQGRATLSFFSADAKTTYHAVIEGFTSKGQLGRATTEMQVK
ncbi:TonB-dependent receptor plug domain-containing protein [Rufibacter glacialis]|uniref:TonB-dependent receptor plug domain-containing protein n=1 Tax=Rufibacter glacialis TaxID=1259555 RepID=A0A5M8QVF5_9BACT|nr:TonB-dependent receptor plug domain-containing protein [Rufibacter glacialis]KAA6438112.1 TonB-dependent receptor plug domain-containing protein [Rufibacter glacialis]GGK88676.1 TonB-dependent receptor [Rufibacter glacialis]